jgi:hypothetical protein
MVRGECGACYPSDGFLKSEFGVYIKALALGKLFEIFRAGGVVS